MDGSSSTRLGMASMLPCSNWDLETALEHIMACMVGTGWGMFCTLVRRQGACLPGAQTEVGLVAVVGRRVDVEGADHFSARAGCRQRIVHACRDKGTLLQGNYRMIYRDDPR